MDEPEIDRGRHNRPAVATNEWTSPKELQNKAGQNNLTNLMSFSSIDGLPPAQFENRRCYKPSAKTSYLYLMPTRNKHNIKLPLNRYFL